MYRVCRVPGEHHRDELLFLHDVSFEGLAPDPDFKRGDWWLATKQRADGREELAAFAGMVPSRSFTGGGYLIRAGVHPQHRGHALQRRLLQVREARARKLGYVALVTDTTNNIPSANNLIAAGFRLFQPVDPWAFNHSLYWKKDL
jgi:ribosomal protein S18 acetylase RimI-like enzyme